MLLSGLNTNTPQIKKDSNSREKMYASKPVHGRFHTDLLYYLCYLPFLWTVSSIAYARNTFVIYLAMKEDRKLAGFTDLLMRISRKNLRRRLKKEFAVTAYKVGRDYKHHSIYIFDGVSSWNHQVKIHAATARVLDFFYRYEEDIMPMLGSNLSGLSTRLWVGSMRNRIAVKHRLYMVVESMEKEIRALEDRGITTICGCSVACGTVRAWRMVMELFPHLEFKITVIDHDPEAITLARDATVKQELQSHFTFITGDANAELEKLHKNQEKFHIVEMVGLNDYLPDAILIRISRKIKACLADNGVYITANIAPNMEQIFLSGVLLWKMIYRSKKTFGNLLSGVFSDVHATSGLWNIHTIAICRTSQ